MRRKEKKRVKERKKTHLSLVAFGSEEEEEWSTYF